MKKLSIILLFALAAVGCSQELPNVQTDKAEVRFGGDITFDVDKGRATTKAAIPFSAPYKGIIAIAKGGSWVGRGYDNIDLAISNVGAMTTTPSAVAVDKNKSYTFYSVAVPADKQIPIRTGDTYPIVFGDQADFIYAQQSAATTNADKLEVSLPYRHLYGKVKFVITANGVIKDADINSATITISGYYNYGTVALKGGAITPAGTFLSEKIIAKETYYHALPQSITATNKLTVTLTLASGEKFSGEITDNNGSIEANKAKTITMTVTGNELTFATTIQDWIGQDINVEY